MIQRSTDVGAALRSRQRGFLLNPYRFGSSTPTDPNFASVTLLMHFNGTNGSTTFVDSSSSPRTLTANGAAQLSTSTVKYGSASGVFTSGSYVSSPANAAFNMGSGAFTIEGWIRPGADGVTYYVIGNSDSSGNNASIGFGIQRTAANKMRIIAFSGAALPVDLTGSTNVLAGSWTHFAFTRSGNNFDVWVNGVKDATTLTVSTTINSSANLFAVGRLGEWAGTPFVGNLDDVRITKGVARYTAGFTPPTAEFPDA